MKTRKRFGWRGWLIALCATLALLFATMGSFVVFASDYYEADEQALAVKAEKNVTKIEEGYLLSSDKNTDTAIIFYPGAKVEAEAYLPLLQGICEEGIRCYLLEMPLNFAFLDVNAADSIIEKNPDIHHWYIAGHSLGGAIASTYASSNADKVDGLLLYAAHPNGDYPLEKTLTVYGSLNTSVANKIDYTENVVEIEGGNHAQFGNYGIQKGDADATISAAKQQKITQKETVAFIFKQTSVEKDVQ